MATGSSYWWMSAEQLTELIGDEYDFTHGRIDVGKLKHDTMFFDSRKKLPISPAAFRHLHIRYSENCSGQIQNSNIEKGYYLSIDRDWLLVVGEQSDEITSLVRKCGHSLKVLKIHNTSLESLDVSRLPSLEELDLYENQNLTSLKGLAKLVSLRNLNLSHTAIKTVSNLGVHPALEVLNLDYSPIQELPPLSTYIKLRELLIAGTKIKQLPPLNDLSNLAVLSCERAPVSLPDYMTFPPNLQRLYIGSSTIYRIPKGIRNLKGLKTLWVRDCRLEDLPDWLPELGLRIGTDMSCGIRLWHTTVKGVDLSIFSQSQEMILQWFEERKRQRELSEAERGTPLNEIKVVFLGDGGAGKSLTVARLLQGGEHPKDFDSQATPGIAIENQEYEIDGKAVQVHFWDFGGQEILHSMHRMFLTQRTLYVVFLNVRDNTQDDRARYWLHNVKSFANDMPVLLVLNQIDQNPGAAINETDLRSLFPNLTEVVRLSALKDSPKKFNEKFTETLKSQIGAFETLESPFLPSWTRLKNELQTMTDHYIRGKKYLQLCEDFGVKGKDVPRDLLHWFNDLGVSFCYTDRRQLKDYVILRPDWLTNAIYILLFNGHLYVKNGIISHEDIYKLLGPDPQEKDKIKRVLPDVQYDATETAYVLGVVRKFRLSYLIGQDNEFIPMLCERNSPPVAAEYSQDPNVLEFAVRYEYLPNNVIHRLMVEKRADLDSDNVWLTGARFVQAANHISAVVKTEGNVLRVFVRGDSSGARPDIYWNELNAMIERINREMGLNLESISEWIIYKENGKTEEFNYKQIMGTFKSGAPEVYSVQLKKMILISDILRQTGYRLKQEQELINSVIKACTAMQGGRIYWTATENDRNTEIRNLLRQSGYFVSDQSLSGRSETGNGPGELDLEISDGDIRVIYEALNIKPVNKSNFSNWNKHLKKLLDNYNPNGLPFLILTSYVECSQDNFNDYWKNYSEHIQKFSPEDYTFVDVTPSHSRPQYTYLRTTERTYFRAGNQFTVYHIFVRVAE